MSIIYKVITAEINVGVAYECDNCGKRYSGTTYNERMKYLPEGWISYFSGHSAWGNDSIKINKRHACTIECLKNIFITDKDILSPTVEIQITFGQKIAQEFIKIAKPEAEESK